VKKLAWKLKGCPHKNCGGDLYSVYDDTTRRVSYKCLMCGREVEEKLVAREPKKRRKCLG
jgi:hypothetical protein